MKLPSNKALVSVAGLIAITATVILTNSPGCFWGIILLIPLIEQIDN